MVKVTNGQIINQVNMILELTKLDLPATVSFNLVKLVRKLNELSKDILETQNKLVEKYGKRDEQGNLVFAQNQKNVVLLNDPQLYAKELSEVYAITQEIDCNKIKETDIKGCNIKPETIIALDWLFEV